MKIIRICPYCKKKFSTTLHAKKFCKKQCATMANKKSTKAKKHTCQWCGQIFTSTRKRKFCDKMCQGNYMKQIGTIRKMEKRIPIKVTLYDAVASSKTEGISYGKYVSLKKIR